MSKSSLIFLSRLPFINVFKSISHQEIVIFRHYCEKNTKFIKDLKQITEKKIFKKDIKNYKKAQKHFHVDNKILVEDGLKTLSWDEWCKLNKRFLNHLNTWDDDLWIEMRSGKIKTKNGNKIFKFTKLQKDPKTGQIKKTRKKEIIKNI